MRPIRRLLVANRGEIAVRIARAAREAGIVPLGIFSEADRGAAYLQEMDDAACVGPAPATESYLDSSRVIAAAFELRADAVHPGYGFLSEREAFARAVIDAGLLFVGPTPEAIGAMGDKTEAKRRARAHDVPVVPGYDGDDQSPDTLREAAAGIGTPLLIKASAGGGGRGMRVVEDLARFDESLEAAQREALGAFGDAKVLLEKYLVRPRHIEFQIVADAYGRTIHLGERECSIQRRHQKIVEEAPSVALDAALRERMGAAAIRAAESVGYTNAGTVEFLLAEDGAFYFLEMNARLQVEHPVTELVHGVDLVRLQFALASGAALDIEQASVQARGWAIEVRITAEDPENGYLPASGKIERFEAPTGPGLRLDSGVGAGSDVSIYYDSMLAKLIAFGPDRSSAIERLTHGLERFRIDGVPTNLPLLLRIARDVTFRAGYTTTAFLTEHANFLRPDPTGDPDEAFLIALGAVLADARSWRIAGAGIPVRLIGTRSVFVTASLSGDGDTWQFDGDFTAAANFEVTGERVVVRSHDERCAGRAAVDTTGVTVTYDARRFRFTFAPAPELGAVGASAQSASSGAVNAPMPGKILKVAVKAGDSVAERDLLVVLEAMKMEHRIEATRHGTVRSVLVEPGVLVASGATLVELEG
ncbi:MAG: ATP-grasp domain-containing protein [Candidatus Eremiobacteraeota bacterium]|nr:ATP-grasp domain-containing protein [Candidatus Eremiobacteraeota bacterium]